MPDPVRESVKQIDASSWLIGDQFILYRQDSAPNEPLWKDSDGFWYGLKNAPDPFPPAEPLPSDSHIRLVHDAGDAVAVWTFGDAFLKVKLTQPRLANTTAEHITLEWLAQQQGLSFAIPRVLHYVEAADRGYLLITRVPGQVLAEAWYTMNERDKDHYVCRIVEICQELSIWRSDTITGIDGKEFSDSWLTLDQPFFSLKPHDLQTTCSKLGMDCSSLQFWHSDLGPYNIIVNSGQIGIIDWEMAGFVPRAWIRTKFGISWAMDFDWWPDVKPNDPLCRAWRERVERKFEKEGYPEVKTAWEKWYKAEPEREASRE